ncbi:MAG: MlaD family protein, partial [Bacteroidales bacterium]|nr:MlaD family protein [Bacteroidales bacterium]
TNTIKLGFFVTIGFLIIIFSIYFIGQQKGLFRQVFHISSIFKDVKGLKVGSNVRFSGINIGTVNNITMLNSYEVKVDFIIDKDVRKFIKMDAVAIIGSEGLMGNKNINIIAGDPGGEIITLDAIIKSEQAVELDDILIELHESSENVTFITKNLVDITDKINNGEGVFGKLFTDTTITKNLDIISYNTAELTNNIAHITKNIDEEKGLLGKLLSDTAYINKFEYTISDITSSANNINIASKNLIGITDKINNGKGMFGKVFTDTTFIENLAMSGKNINIASENLAKITKNINSGDGIINKLLTDSTLTDSLKITLYNLNKGIKEIDAAAKSIKGNWFIRAFSKNDKKEELEDTTKN